MTTQPLTNGADAPAETGLEVRRYRVLAGCVECASDLTPLRRVEGVRDVKMLSASGVLAIQAPKTLSDTVLLRTAAASGLTLEPEKPAVVDEAPQKKSRWWLRPEMILLGIAALFMVGADIVTRRAPEATTLANTLAIISIAFGIIYPGRNALMMLRNKRFTINVLLVVAVIGAIPLGKFVEAACVVVIFSLGIILESFVADRARKSIQKLMDLAPRRAERFTFGGAVETVPVEELGVGDLVLVRPGARLPTDGEVTQGASWIDTSAITGESMPVEVVPGEAVYGGTLNGDGALRVKVTKQYQDTVLARVIREVEEAQQNRGRAQRFADKFGAIYTPAMIGVAVLMVVLGPLVFGLTFTDAFYRALVVLIVSCSCALVLSVPVSVVSAVARAARDGVLIKGGAYLEELGRLKAVAFDKTGTLTLGRPALVAVHTLDGDRDDELLRLAAAVEAAATHPIAEAIVHAARDRGIDVRPADDVSIVAGKGAEATVDGRRIAVGRVADYSKDASAAAALAEIEQAGATPVAVTADGALIGLLGVADELRPEAKAAIAELRSLGVTHTVMLTGDRERVARSIADQLGIESVRAELMPADKSAEITAMRNERGTVAMVGDGVNDAPALATSNVAVVMGAAGTDVAMETADVALMSDDLTKLPYTVRLARRANRIIAQNVAVSLIVIAALVVAALIGAFNLTQGVLINEAFALVIIANGLRLLRGGKSGKQRTTVTAPTKARAEHSATLPKTAFELPVVESVTAGGGCGDDCGCGTKAEAPQVEAPKPAAPKIVPLEQPVASGGGCGDNCGCGSSDKAVQQVEFGRRTSD
ncbi:MULTISPECIES: heavy metal translocating P-type ATPase [Saccharothrix]|uniref:heavy metal translocating P-type ATPase n=1 Tax=Saccharothrix TaxID=2071 RepID=UPI001160FC95|nr:cation-translocating P-type ATPase [Saccharothrix sp. CB00851]